VPQHLTPTPADYAKDIAQSYAAHKANNFLLPEYSLQFMGIAVRRALHAEKLLATIHSCTSIRAAHALVEQSGIPGLDTTIAQAERAPSASA
jgi:hypothetical protein